jgi:hypothetical protein
VIHRRERGAGLHARPVADIDAEQINRWLKKAKPVIWDMMVERKKTLAKKRAA